MLEKTKRAVDGMNGTIMKSRVLCESCVKGKMTKIKIPKMTKPRPLMDTISGDEQGPFRISGFDGSINSLKNTPGG
jgi:hypothetical protein